MAIDKKQKRIERKQDIIHLAILVAIALVIGVYLIATTVLISKDGVFYIERAQKFSSDPIGIIKGHPFGYPFFIYAAHKIVSFFTNNSSIYIWIYCAQGVNLLLRTLTFIPLYFIGKMLVGGRKSFWALLILTVLPYPAEFGSDALRDWPNVFFLACGFWAVLSGAKNGNWWIFGLAGLSAGLGYMVRPACVQLVAYGIVWLVYCFFRTAKTFSRSKTVLAVGFLLAGFLIPAGPYTVARGKILPDALYPVIKSFSSNSLTNKAAEDDIDTYKKPLKYTAGIEKKILEAAGNLIEKASANLMWYFVLPLLIGIYYHFRKTATQEEKLLITTFISLNIILLFLRYCCSTQHLTHRYILPLTVFTIFYIPTGLNLLSCWIVSINRRDEPTISMPSDKVQRFFYILLAIGLFICLPKLVRPIRIEKQGYREAAKWLRENSTPEDVIAVPDRRLYFYAGRNGVIYENEEPAAEAGYVVKILKSGDEESNSNRDMRKEYSVWVNKREQRKKLVIYKMM